MIPWNSILIGDNIGFLKQMVADGMTFNLILTDPPYNLKKDFGNDTDSQTEEDFLKGIDQRSELMSKLLSPNGALILFCSQMYVGNVQLILKKHLLQRRLMMWYYKNGMSRQEREPITEFEPFWWFTKSEDFVYNRDDVRVPYRSERVKNPVYKKDRNGNKVAWRPNPLGAKRGDVWEYPALAGKVFEGERTEHPTQKPMDFFVDIVKAFCPKNADNKFEGRILDPYIGSGTTAVACERLNRTEGHAIKWIGMELEEKWAEVANDRVAKEKAKTTIPDMFGE